mmetsp:Transcript_8903/g.13701  ORF Transcript_8903/g.13701 Transcript_8903/m.13701 type:complete len:84 (-) Transcript_8903:67-318(-)
MTNSNNCNTYLSWVCPRIISRGNNNHNSTTNTRHCLATKTPTNLLKVLLALGISLHMLMTWRKYRSWHPNGLSLWSFSAKKKR